MSCCDGPCDFNELRTKYLLKKWKNNDKYKIEFNVNVRVHRGDNLNIFMINGIKHELKKVNS